MLAVRYDLPRVAARRHQGRARAPAARDVPLPRAAPARRRRGAGHARRGRHAAARAAAARRAPGPAASLGQGRGPEPDRHLQGARARHGDHARAHARRHGPHDPVRGQRGRRGRGLRGPRGRPGGGGGAARHARGRGGGGGRWPAPTSSRWTAPSPPPGAPSRRSRPRSAGSIWPRSRSRTGSRARRPWASSSPSSSAGMRRTVLVYPTGGGTGLVGIWKAYEELAGHGLDQGRASRASSRCRPRGARRSRAPGRTRPRPRRPSEHPFTNAPGLRVPGPFAGRQMLRILRETGGFPADSRRAGHRGCPATAGPGGGDLDGARGGRHAGRAPSDAGRGPGDVAERIVLILTGAGIKYPPPPLPPPVHLEGTPDQILARVKEAIRA